MIGIIAAMRCELEAITNLMDQKDTSFIHGIEMVEGSIHGKNIVVMLSGVGKGNAAMSTTILLSNKNIDKVINIGTAGGLVETQNILNAVISDKIVQYDYDTSPVDGEDGIGLYFQSDEHLMYTCIQVLKELNIPMSVGLVASGDQFVAYDEQVEWIKKRFPNAICCEMEAGAVAQVCTFFQVPFVILRSLSDVAVKKDSHMDFLEYVGKAAKRSGDFVSLLLKKEMSE